MAILTVPDYTGPAGPTGPTGPQGNQGVATGVEMAIGGNLPTTAFPYTELAPRIAGAGASINTMGFRRATPGNSGTTTIQLQVNGADVPGATLSWTPADGAWALKTVTFADFVVSQYDRITLTLSSAEPGAADVIGVVL